MPMLAGRLLAVMVPAALVGAAASAQGVFDTEVGRVRVETVAAGLEHPWSLAFLPDGAMLVTERPGRIRLVAPDGSMSPALEGAPQTRSWGQGGMLDIALDPDSEIITATDVTPGNSGDAEAAETLLSDILSAEADDSDSDSDSDGGAAVYGDAAYGAGELLERLDNAGIHNGLKVQPPAAGIRPTPVSTRPT